MIRIESELAEQRVKIAILGDGRVGKTCILLSQKDKKFPSYVVPQILDIQKLDFMVDKSNVNLIIQDTGASEAFESLKTPFIGQADVYIITFSVVDASTFENALQKWYPELNKDDYKMVPKIFLGNKTDLRDDNCMDHIQPECAKFIIGQLGEVYFECSALNLLGLNEAFNKAIRDALKNKKLLPIRNSIKNEQEHDQPGGCGCELF